ncbi:hypothetical protein GOV11_03725 [Candidatus Woesearchaeota archaeon]|nr:hypothetical protein [Candidatus Woesearchaeota archaeon]
MVSMSVWLGGIILLIMIILGISSSIDTTGTVLAGAATEESLTQQQINLCVNGCMRNCVTEPGTEKGCIAECEPLCGVEHPGS